MKYQANERSPSFAQNPEGAGTNGHNAFLERRQVLKGLLASTVVGTAPCAFLKPAAAATSAFDESAYTVFRNACPRNCYDTCSLKTYVKDHVVAYVEGAPESTYTRGGLCVKGYAYPNRVYSPDRIKYPMIQEGRGSGNWRRITWEEAMDRIAKKILELKQRDGSLLGLGLTKYSGNFGITNYVVEGMMSSLGYTTRFIGTPCWPAGIDAQSYDLGDMWCNDPEDMAQAQYILLWGANPAWNSVHSMKYIYAAQDKGAKVVVIDPIFTQTAAKADEYWQVRAGTDGMLALGMIRHILDTNSFDNNFIEKHSLGFAEFANYVLENISVEQAAEVCGISAERIRNVAEAFAAARPATIWIGYGMQRHTNGGANVRCIDALAALTGNIGKVGGGARYGQMRTWGFNYYGMAQKPPEGSVGFIGSQGPKGEFDFAGNTADTGTSKMYSDRSVNINKTAEEILTTNDPSIKMLWAACKNPFAQDFDRNKLEKAFNKLEMVVSVEQFFTETVRHSDIVLPVTTLFEEWSVNVSYWHYWLSLNEQAIEPLHEAKCNFEIAALLSQAMNRLEPGSSTFPEKVNLKEAMIQQFNPELYAYFGITDWTDLQKGPAKAQLASSASWNEYKFATPSGKYEFLSELCAKNGHNALPVYVPGRKPYAPFRVLTPHTQFGIHSQFINLDWMHDFYPEPFVYLHPSLAQEKGIHTGQEVRVYNDLGEVRLKAQVTTNVPKDVLLMYEAWFKQLLFNVQNVIDDTASDMGAMKTGAPGVAIHDQFANISAL